MTGKEARQHARDMRTVERAVNDAEKGEFHDPISLSDTFLPGGMTEEKLHDHNVYREAWRETWDNRD